MISRRRIFRRLSGAEFFIAWAIFWLKVLIGVKMLKDKL